MEEQTTSCLLSLETPVSAKGQEAINYQEVSFSTEQPEPFAGEGVEGFSEHPGPTAPSCVCDAVCPAAPGTRT